MQLVFLGTASCYPTPSRGVSCTALRFESGDVWLFDCGEGSQVQLQKSSVRPGNVTKIFITHLHGDHMFGLPGMICTLGNQLIDRPNFLLEIYGPLGLRRYLREALCLSRSPLPFRYTVHELLPVAEQFPEDWNAWSVDHSALGSSHPQEELGRDIAADGEHKWTLFETDDVTVCAGSVVHRIPTYGFVVCESNKPGRLDVERLRALNIPAGPLYGCIKRGESITSPAGITIHPSEVLGPPKVGRKLTILGDTKDATSMCSLAEGSDVVIHEATLENSMAEKALLNGHSTPSMAAAFSKKVQASILIIYHFSQRYPEKNVDMKCEGSVEQLVVEAQTALSGCPCKVMAAQDMMEFTIPRRDKSTNDVNSTNS